MVESVARGVVGIAYKDRVGAGVGQSPVYGPRVPGRGVLDIPVDDYRPGPHQSGDPLVLAVRRSQNQDPPSRAEISQCDEHDEFGGSITDQDFVRGNSQDGSDGPAEPDGRGVGIPPDGDVLQGRPDGRGRPQGVNSRAEVKDFFRSYAESLKLGLMDPAVNDRRKDFDLSSGLQGHRPNPKPARMNPFKERATTWTTVPSPTTRLKTLKHRSMSSTRGHGNSAPSV
jgi:hypothetical protein